MYGLFVLPPTLAGGFRKTNYVKNEFYVEIDLYFIVVNIN